MKLVFKKDDLAFATQTVNNLVNPQSSLPIMSNILIRANSDEGVVDFVASDLESNVKCSAAAEIDQPFSVTAPSATFTNLVRELPDAPISLELLDDQVVISCESLRYQLATRDPVDFPVWPEFDIKTSLELPQKALRRAIECVVFAIPQRDPRKVLLGSLFDFEGQELKCVATDGKKLGYIQLPVAEGSSAAKAASAIMPHKILSELLHTLKDEGTVKILFGERQVAFDLGSVLYVSNKLDGTYPDYNQIIPKSFERTIRLNKQALTRTIRQAAIIADEKNHSVKMNFTAGGLNISAMTYDIGSFASSMAVDYAGDDYEIVFNHRYLSEVIRLIAQDELELKVNNPGSPVVIVGVDVSDALFVVMPIKITDLADTAEGEED